MNPTTGRRQQPRFLTIVSAFVLTLVGFVTVAPQVAHAGPYRVGYAVQYSGYTKTVGTLDSRSGSGGHRLICVNSRYADPDSLGSSTNKTDAELNYLMLKYIDSETNNARGAALAEIVKRKLDESPTWRSGVWEAFKDQYSSSTVKAVNDYIDDLRTEAERYAGPYTMSVSLEPTTSGKGQVTNLGVKAKSGRFYNVDGTLKITLTLSGPAYFDANGAKTMTVNAAQSALTYPVTATAAGRVTVAAQSNSRLPNTRYRYYSGSGSIQDMVSANFTRTSVSATDYVDSFLEQVLLSSTVGSAYAADGDRLVDHVTVTAEAGAAHAGKTVPVRTTLYGPFGTQPSEQPDPPANAPVVQAFTRMATLDANGRATVTFTSDPVSGAGYYVWRETTLATTDFEPAESSFGRASETTAVSDPRLSTQVSDQTSHVGDTISDTVVVSDINLVSNPATPLTITLTGQLLGPLNPVGGVCTGLDWSRAPVAATLPSRNVTGNGTISGYGPHTIDAPGCYTYTETLTGQSGGDTVFSVTHAPGDPAQTTLAIGTPELESTVGSSYAAPGSALTDMVRISTVGAGGSQVRVSTTLYGPFPTQPSVQADPPAGAPVVQTFTRNVTIDDDDITEVTFTSDPVPAAGYYVWREQTAATPILEAATSTFGRASETTAVWEPTVATQVSDQTSEVGDTITDSVIIAGIQLVDDAATPLTMTLSGQLLGPLDPVGGMCTGLDWSGAPVAATLPSRDVTGNGTISGYGEHTITAPGCYTYTETLTGTTENGTVFEVTHEPGDPAQTTLATAPIAADSQVGTTVVRPGTALTDMVTVTGLPAGQQVTVTTTLYGPLAAPPAGQTPDVPVGAPVAQTFSRTVTGTASGTVQVTFTSAPVTEPGFYVWRETVDASTAPLVTQDTVATTFGRPSETSVVVNPSVATQVSSQDTTIGTITDRVDVTGVTDTLAWAELTGTDITITLTGQLLGPLQPVDGVCTGLNWDGAPVATEIGPLEVTEDGTLDNIGTADVTPGCYTYTETLTATDGDGATVWQENHPAGHETQTALVRTPWVTTQVSTQLTGPGATLTDTITVGNVGPAPATVTSILYGPYPIADDQQCDVVTDQMWRDAIADETVSGSAPQTITVNGDGDYTTEPVPSPAAGCWTWWTKLAVGPDPENPVFEVESEYGIVSETAVVIAPTLSTVAITDADQAVFTDRVTIAGTHGMAGRVDGSILGPVARRGGTCATVDWTAAPKLADTTIEFAGDGTYLTTPVTVKAKGCYTFVQTLTMADPTVDPVHAAAGIPAETLFLVPRGGGGGGINSGEPLNPVPIVAVGAGLILLGGLVGLLAWRRRKTA